MTLLHRDINNWTSWEEKSICEKV